MGASVSSYPVLMEIVWENSSCENKKDENTPAAGNIATDVSSLMAKKDHIPEDEET